MKRNKNPWKERERKLRFQKMDLKLCKGSKMKSLGDHVCQKWDILELQNMTMGRKDAP